MMREVRVHTTLKNAGDEVLVRRGFLKPDQVRSYEADALIDTGAISTVLPVQVDQQLGLAIVSRQVAEFADGGNDTVDVTEPIEIVINGRRTVEETLALGNEVIIGQTVLEKLELLVDCINRRVIPNPAHPDQPVLKVK
jgi:clan AA aspartic protease